MNSFIMIILGIVVFRLHIYLCTKENKFLGLIIPGVNFILSINAVAGIVMFSSMTMIDGVSVNNAGAGMNGIFQYILIFIMYNIPTLILLGIYFSSRKRLNKNKEINKMNIQDLN